jgi:hypothetical protein
MAKKSKVEEFIESYNSGDHRKTRQMIEDEKKIAASQPKGSLSGVKRQAKRKRKSDV